MGQTNAPQAVPVREMAEAISGAVFDFAAYLTTRPETRAIGAAAFCAPWVVEEVKAWAALRGLSLDDADVMHWNTKPRAPQQSVDVDAIRREAAREALTKLQERMAEKKDERGRYHGWYPVNVGAFMQVEYPLPTPAPEPVTVPENAPPEWRIEYTHRQQPGEREQFGYRLMLGHMLVRERYWLAGFNRNPAVVLQEAVTDLAEEFAHGRDRALPPDALADLALAPDAAPPKVIADAVLALAARVKALEGGR